MRTRCGLTLIEVLVLIAIIMILAALFLPIFKSSNESARRTTCASHLHQIGKAMFMYADVPANGIFPTCSTTTDPYADSEPLAAMSLLYRGYVADPRVFWCPCLPPLPPPVSRIVPTVNAPPEFNVNNCAYGYDPGHSPKDLSTAILADRKGKGQNSDTHGRNAGQNVCLGSGNVEYRTTPINPVAPAGAAPLLDTDIFSLEPAGSKVGRDKDAYIRQ